jgi:hypothetical protein
MQVDEGPELGGERAQRDLLLALPLAKLLDARSVKHGVASADTIYTDCIV